jgi:hypothetical protein
MISKVQYLISDLSVSPNLNLKCEWLCQKQSQSGNMVPQVTPTKTYFWDIWLM